MALFDHEKHEQRLAERYRRLSQYDAFDKLVDLALDGQISLSEAISEFKTDYVPGEGLPDDTEPV
jgi:hypothetical protein